MDTCIYLFLYSESVDQLGTYLPVCSAMQHYQLAADFFRGEESNSAANKCLVKVAQYAAQLDNFEKGMFTSLPTPRHLTTVFIYF